LLATPNCTILPGEIRAYEGRSKREEIVKQVIGSVVVASALILASLGQSPVAQAAGVFKLGSSAFEDGGIMPKKFANNTANNPNCVGDNVSPPLSWENPPDGTTSYVLLMLDPEGRGGLGVSHWVAYGIPVSVTGFAEGETSKLTDKYVGGKSTQGVGFYSGPCTPPGAYHHYTFTLIATDLDPKALQPGMARDEVLAAINGHAKGATGLVGRFTHP
jgi:Raf kinase inhibitor-like YbhB/YbcL family protein